MPMPNLRHQMKGGRKERRAGTVTPAMDRCFLPAIAPRYQEYGQARDAHAHSVFVRLPAIQKTQAEVPKKTTKPSRLPVLVETRFNNLPKTAKPSRLPVLVDTRFNNLPKCGMAASKVMEMRAKRPAKLGYDFANGDNIRKSDVDAAVDPSCTADSWHIDSIAEDKRKRIEKYAKIFDVYVRETAEAMEREKQDAIRKERIEKYAKIFDVYVRETAEAMEREKQDAIRKERIEKYAKIFEVYVRETAEAMKRDN